MQTRPPLTVICQSKYLAANYEISLFIFPHNHEWYNNRKRTILMQILISFLGFHEHNTNSFRLSSWTTLWSTPTVNLLWNKSWVDSSTQVCADTSGLHHALATLRQLIRLCQAEGLLPALHIDDRPSLRLRAILLDVTINGRSTSFFLRFAFRRPIGTRFMLQHRSIKLGETKFDWVKLAKFWKMKHDVV